MTLQNRYDVIGWITKTINSCETIEQLQGAFKLIENFHSIYGDSKTYQNLRIEAIELEEELVRYR